TEWVGPYNDLALGLYKVAKYYYWPGMHEPGTQIEGTVDKAKLTALPKDVQRNFKACCHNENNLLTSELNARNGGALETLIRERQVQRKRFPNDVLHAYGEAAGEVIQEMREGVDPITKEIIESLLKARRDQMHWARVADKGYVNARLHDIKYPTPA